MSSIKVVVLMMVNEVESDCGQSTLEHLLGGSSSTQVVEAGIETNVVRSVTDCGNTVVDQANKAGL